MAKYVTRDYIWNYALKDNGPVTADDVQERVPEDVTRKTVRDCLNTMQDMGFLDRVDVEEGGRVHYDSSDRVVVGNIEFE